MTLRAVNALRAFAALFVVLASTVAGYVPARAAPPTPPNARKQLLAELAQIADHAGGTLGVSALHLPSGERVQLNASQRFPMASTVKVAIAIKVLDEVDRGTARLDETVAIDAGNLAPGSGEIKNTRPDSQRTATLRELVSAMMRESDNTATDLLLARVGGPPAVALHLRKIGIDEIDVSRPTAELVALAWGFKLPAPGERTGKALQQAQAHVSPNARQAAARAFLADARDSATPDAMVALLDLLFRGKALSPASTEFLVGEMEQCRTGPRRMKGELPRGMVVAHKTGTLTRVATNDVGIVRMSGGRGDLVVALFVKGSPKSIAEQERAIALATRALYRYYQK